MKWFIVIWILLGWSFYPVRGDLCAAQAERVEKELTKKKEELKRIKNRLRLKQKEKEAILRKESSIRRSLVRVQKDLQKRERVLKQKRAKLDQIKKRIRDTENQILILTKNTELMENRLSLDLQALYKASRVPLEAYLFSVPSSADLLKMGKYLCVLLEHHAELTKTYKHEIALRRGDERKLAENYIQLKQLISREEKKKEKIKKLWNQERARLKSTVNQKATCQTSITEMGKRSRLIQSLIDKLEREKRVLSSEKSKYVMLKGKLRLPVQGKVVSFFKERGANGIEIEAAIGSPVQAVLPGKVLYADWFKGFGNIIIIDHGDSMVTISGNCSKLNKKRGDTVSQGEVIAQIGSLESEGNSRLYFEIRHRGKPQDPLEWILSGKNKHP